jgi:hypothetical protein
MSSMSFPQRLLYRKFDNWLHEQVYMGEHVVPRQKILYWFICDLCESIRGLGFVLIANEYEIACNFAKYVFKVHRNPLKSFRFDTARDATKEDYEHYINLVSCEFLDSFWSTWDDIEDFSKDTFAGRKSRYSLTSFIWMYIDVTLARSTGLSDDESVGEEITHKKPTTDPYLMDQAGYINRFGRWE